MVVVITISISNRSAILFLLWNLFALPSLFFQQVCCVFEQINSGLHFIVHGLDDLSVVARVLLFLLPCLSLGMCLVGHLRYSWCVCRSKSLGTSFRVSELGYLLNLEIVFNLFKDHLSNLHSLSNPERWVASLGIIHDDFDGSDVVSVDDSCGYVNSFKCKTTSWCNSAISSFGWCDSYICVDRYSSSWSYNCIFGCI